MAILPFRGLAEKGILHDPSPYQLDISAFSDGAGVRFADNKAMRAPIFRSVVETLPDTPGFCVGNRPSSGYDTVFIAGQDGKLYSYASSAVTDVTPYGKVLYLATTATGSGYTSAPTVAITGGGGTGATATAVLVTNYVWGFIVTNPGSGYTSAPTVTLSGGGGTLAAATALIFTAATDPRAWNSTFLGNVTFINRPNAPPFYFGPTSTQFTALPGWDGGWTCRSLRAYGDYLIALNVTKAGVSTPSMVKWSDLTLAGLPPGSWNQNDPTTSGGENPLEDLTTPIVDGLAMRSVFVIYSQNQIWAMQQNGGQSIFTWSLLFNEGGLLAPNCAVEVDGRHYVFGPTDIYVHDGVSKQSIIDKRNRDYVYRNLNVRASEVCFALYMPQYNDILFAYQTGDANAYYQNPTLCNKGALYNIPNDTWSFIDLPNVAAAALANLNGSITWATATQTWATVGGSYFDQDSGYGQNVCLVSAPLTTQLTQPRLLAYDFYDKGTLSFPFSTEANGPVYLERTGLDLEQEGSDLTSYKNVRRVYPLVTIFDNTPIQIMVGGSMTPTGPVVWSSPLLFNPTTDYKVDCMIGGRYVAIRFLVTDPVDFEIAGFDLDVVPAGRR